MRDIDEIIIHCTASKEGQDVRAKDVDRWHKKRGFSKIGYHYLIDLDGTIEIGRKEEEIGAHCLQHNARSIGVCYVGGLDPNLKPKDTRTAAQKESLIRLLKELKRKYPKATIHGHNEFANKACPCFNARVEYSNL